MGLFQRAAKLLGFVDYQEGTDGWPNEAPLALLREHYTEFVQLIDRTVEEIQTADANP
jgi:hypothetical protein